MATTIRDTLRAALADAFRAGQNDRKRETSAGDYADNVVGVVAHELRVDLGRMVDDVKTDDLAAILDHRPNRLELAATMMTGVVQGRNVIDAAECANVALALADALIAEARK